LNPTVLEKSMQVVEPGAPNPERSFRPAPTTVASAKYGSEQGKRSAVLLLWIIAVFFLALFAWAYQAEIDTVARAQGKVIPSAKLQIVQNLEGGIVQDIHIKQGQTIEKGQQLVTLNALQYEADRKAKSQQLLALEVKAARLMAQANETEPQYPALAQRRSPDVVNSETAAFLSKRLELQSQIDVLSAQSQQKQRELEETRASLSSMQSNLELSRQERDTIDRLVKRGLEPRLELVRIDRSVAELEGRIEVAKVALKRVQSGIEEIASRQETVRRQYKSEALGELNKVLAEVATLKESMPAFEDRVARTDVRSPMKGIVNRVFVNTVGGVAKPGEPLVEIVPADEDLVVEAMVVPKDIGFVKMDQTARVRLTAYDYSIYGAIDGKVVNIGADAIPNDKGEAFYLVRVEMKKASVDSVFKDLSILPGMQAQIDIITGGKTVWQYLSKPLVAVKENAFRER
jgi:membrane fusion protein, adhesin transport system